ncbi:hypothetical protein [Streptomyces sp. NPDC126499]|uniref:hypothetical protein n=1 Tax=Streptomyces sp. NPDC126499 TaxID=3155314 RepID=UPI00331D506C
MHERLGVAPYLLGPHVEPPDERDPERELWDEVFAEMRGLLAELGRRVNDEAPALASLVRAVVSMRALGYRSGRDDIRRYAEALRPIAEEECTALGEHPGLEEAIEATVAYTILYEPVLLALRRPAHEDVSARLHGVGPDRTRDTSISSP